MARCPGFILHRFKDVFILVLKELMGVSELKEPTVFIVVFLFFYSVLSVKRQLS